MNIQQLHNQGFNNSQIATKLGISRTTVYEYLRKSPEEMAVWLASSKLRRKKLGSYEEHIVSWLKEHPDLSAAQVYDWLQERYPSLKVGESTTRSYVRELREKYHIPKVKEHRHYQAIPDPPMGQQAQVDFGQTKQKTSRGKEIKLYFISFVLSHSRYKYAEWLDRPFTTRDVIRAHESAFQHFEGIPYELVYDQDALLVVNENAGDIILTNEFQSYREERKLNIHLCRKADPESKGKIENVVGFVKKNFAKNRVFHRLDHWNEQCLSWLKRTGNGKVHNTTKKRPAEVFTLEKQHLRPVSSSIKMLKPDSSISRTVRKDNTILYESNRYSVPLGTYGKTNQVYIEVTVDEHLVIREQMDGPIIAEHSIDYRKGVLVQDRQHTRDRTKGIDAYIHSIAEQFEDVNLAHRFLEEVRRTYPRYIRDQLQMISKTMKSIDTMTMDLALKECMKRKLWSASEFHDAVEYVKRQRQVNIALSSKHDMKPLNQWDQSLMEIKPRTRDVKEYIAILKGESI
ncbi:IS21 family transposase [Caldalkalibacillus mannanilyticus]|uniref:IS21 family transposase n=1 Tax=Caldalkalibacillus mannanilyticus TaxID=1418 RepID=UPI0011DD238D|nr:IS21 family transposase [Caldalkalibacillus mannanilyticus]